MIYTQRTLADYECEGIKEKVKLTSLNYFTQESPFTLNIFIKKSFLKDYSPAADKPPNSFTSQTTLSPTMNDSGVQHDFERHIDEASLNREQDDKIFELNEKIKQLGNDLDMKDSIIKTLNSKINSTEDISKNIKNELKTKNEQIKQHKNNTENARQKLDKTMEEKEILKNNLSKKILNLEDKIKHLTTQIDKSNAELETKRNELKKIRSDRQSMKNIQTQTEAHAVKTVNSLSTQTVTKNKMFNEIGIQTEIKMEIDAPNTQIDLNSSTPKSSRTSENKTTLNVTNKTEKDLIFKKSTPLTNTAKPFCESCFGNHSISEKLIWPKRQYYYSKFLPISANQHEWPDKRFIDGYMADFGDHTCEECLKEDAPWKETTCDSSGVNTIYRGSSVYVCPNNLIEFGSLCWWERVGVPGRI